VGFPHAFGKQLLSSLEAISSNLTMLWARMPKWNLSWKKYKECMVIRD